jgi:hypothetical protein
LDLLDDEVRPQTLHVDPPSFGGLVLAVGETT